MCRSSDIREHLVQHTVQEDRNNLFYVVICRPGGLLGFVPCGRIWVQILPCAFLFGCYLQLGSTVFE